MEKHNGKSGYQFCKHLGAWNLYRFDLSVNGSKSFVVTARYPTSEQAIIAGDEWIKRCLDLDRDAMIKLLCNPD